MAPDPMTLINRAEGKTLAQLLKQGIGGWLLGVSVALIAGAQTVLEFLFLPFDIFIDLAGSSVSAFLLEPMDLPAAGYGITARALESLGIAAGPVSTGIALFGIVIVLGYLALNITSNFLPGLIVDNVVLDFFFTSPEEEADGEE